MAQEKNKFSLRELSRVLRLLSTQKQPAEMLSLIKEAVEKAKDAVGMDVQDGESWCMVIENINI